MPKAPAKPRVAGALARPLKPSPALAAIVGHEPLARTAVVSKLWAYIKHNKLQDPADKRGIIADAKLHPIFGAERVTMFELAKVIGATSRRRDGKAVLLHVNMPLCEIHRTPAAILTAGHTSLRPSLHVHMHP